MRTKLELVLDADDPETLEVLLLVEVLVEEVPFIEVLNDAEALDEKELEDQEPVSLVTVISMVLGSCELLEVVVDNSSELMVEGSLGAPVYALRFTSIGHIFPRELVYESK